MSQEKYRYKDKNVIGTRLREFRELKNKKVGEFAKIIGISQGSLSDIENLKTKPSAETIASVVRNTDISAHWLLTGEGDAENVIQDVVREDHVAFRLTNGDRFQRVGVYILAGAGNPNELTEREPVDELILPKHLCKPSILPVKVRGKSMEPLILDGAVVGVDRTDKWVISGEIYAVWLPYEGAVVKRLYLDPEQLTLRSDNTKFPDIVIPVKTIGEDLIQGRVKWVLQEI